MDIRLLWRGVGVVRKKFISTFVIDIYLVLLVLDFLDDVQAQSSSTAMHLEDPVSNEDLNVGAFTRAYEAQFKGNVTRKTEKFNVTLFHQNVTWNEADVTCKVYDGYLLSILPKASALYSHLQKSGIECLWTGIHRKANYYIQDYSDYLRSFKSSKEKNIDENLRNIGEKWIDDEDFLFDCVVLSFKRGRLMTQNCSLLCPFVCESKKPLMEGEDGCPEAWHLSPPLSKDGRICISKVMDVLPYDKAENTCAHYQSRLATSNEYRILILRNQLYLNGNDQEFWALNEDNKSCVYGYFQDMNSNREHPCTSVLNLAYLPFVCVKPMETENWDVIIEIGSSENSVDSYQFIKWNSTCNSTKNDKIICRTKNSSEKDLTFQLFRDGFFIENITPAAYLGYLEHGYKRRKKNSQTKISNAIQGSYHCELRLRGSLKTYRSKKINLFYPDVASYIIDIHGIERENYVDYSHSGFDEKMDQINSAIKTILGEKEADWDFKSIQRTGESYSMKLIVFKHRNDSYDDEKVYLVIAKKFEENVSSFQLGKNLSISVNSADVCFSRDSIPEDTCDEIKWPTTKEVKNVLTERACINDQKKIIHRECKSSNLVKAEWSSFNCSVCERFLERYQDEAIQCPNGYQRLNSQDICFKIYYEKKNWFDAHKTCSNLSSYLLDIPHEIHIDNISSLWLSFRFSYGKIQGFGQKPINLKALYDKEEMLVESTNMRSHDLYCVSAVTEESGFKVKFSDCKEEMPFVCMQKIYENVNSSSFKNNFKRLYKQNNAESCYYLEDTPYHWEDATKFCELNLHGAKLLSGVQDIDSYRYIKKLIIDQTNGSECDATTWWVDFEDIIHNGIPPNLSYIDWGPTTDFNISEPHGVITLFPDKKIYWSLEEKHKTVGLICKVQKCFSNQLTPIYLENERLYETNGTEDAVTWLSSFNWMCKSRGLYITGSSSLYLDNILIGDESSLVIPIHRSYNYSVQEALKLQGDFSCSVDLVKNKETVYSSKQPIRIPGFYTFVIFMTTEDDHFLDECPKYILSTSLIKTTALYKCFNKLWKDTLNLKEFHFHLKSIMCYSNFINITVHLYFKNHIPEEGILEMLQKADFSNFCEACNISESIVVKSTAYCYSEKMSLKNIDLKWPTTKLGRISFSEPLCLINEGTLIQRTCTGDLNSGTVWTHVSATECTVVDSPITKELVNVLLSENVTDLLKLTSDPKQLTPIDVQVIGAVLSSLAQPGISFSCHNLSIVVETVSNVIDMNRKVLSVAAKYSNSFVDLLEKITSNINEETCDKNISTKNVHVNLYSINSSESQVPNSVLLSKSHTKSLFNASIKDLESNMQNFEAGLVIPKSLLHTPDLLSYFFLENIYFQENISVASLHISVSFRNAPVVDLGDEKILMSFKLKSDVDINNLSSLRCAFWNIGSNTWDSEGCSTNISDNIVFCSCNHLTSFAAIMVKSESPPDQRHENSLTYITYIGGSLSCIGMGIIILSFLFFREWRQSVKNKCLCNFSLSYLLFLTIYMAGIEKTDSGNGCKVIAVLLHYFLLSSFMWMIVLAYTVYLSLVKVYPTYIPCLIQKAMLFAWGVPVVIVSSTLLGNYKHYFGEKLCWISEYIFDYAVVIPLVLMLTINYFIFVTILYVNLCGVHNIACNQDRRKLLITRAKALLCISVLLGLSWIFKFLAEKATYNLQIIFTYLFTITTAFQGFFLATFFIFLPETPRQLWIKLLTSPKAVFKSHSHVTSSYVTNPGSY